ncbi:1-acyl-sn-glycerol-3-phosphate acyltransferase [Sunxiuqinia elliptica]|uniref:1-acyl-sn-glycerol-3-phosphate acyltransferase n=1 Tax=Sunxiuqinia elliptica TaxID=655355 RepID=A0A4R6H8X4_9BACT|nr:1-acyl-sn-glycerol-3-phosphate acyltransferase [Sunxiuqinia elliptica]TDO04893.1 1-acyl-sn-glycerol-3-phosphate acyltransferase [Sunxiuqinia elliptica]TDO64441.1 1-acyl-sn-glycerol-3-phosphate acyltransferase [Sunxiuqinia elliptica]
MKKWSLGYAILKQVVRFAFWISHKRITIIGKQHLNKNHPLIFAPNHQNALMDPLAVLCTTPMQPVWLARADIFKMKLVRPILRFLKIMPVYRIRDGKENLGENEKIFSQAIEVLEHKKQLGLFPEAAHSGKRQMLPHKKAVPRIAFLAESKNKFKLQLQIIPVGIYYSHYWHFNRELLVNYGSPINLKDYKTQYETNALLATKQLREELNKRVEQLTINIKSKTHYENYEWLRELLGRGYAQKQLSKKPTAEERFLSDQQLVGLLEIHEAKHPEMWINIHQQIDEIRATLDSNSFPIDLLEKQTNGINIILQGLLGIVLLPLIFVGLIFHIIPFSIPRHFIQKNIKDPAFYSTFHFVSGLILYSISSLIITILSLYLFNSLLITLLILIGFLLGGKLSFLSFASVKMLMAQIRWFFFSKKHPQELNDLKHKKEILKEQMIKIVNF